MTEPRAALDIFKEYFDEEATHFQEVKGMIDKIKPVYETDPHMFMVVVFSICTKVGRERPDFAMDMMLSWLRDKIINLEEVMPEAFEGKVKFDS